MMETIGTDATPVEILLAEDSPGEVRLTREAFTDSKVHVNLHVASNGVDWLAFLGRVGEHAGAPRPDLILLDLSLPLKDGREGHLDHVFIRFGYPTELSAARGLLHH